MRVLLDTHVFLWWLSDSPRLGRRARVLLASPRSTVLVSAVSIWEIAVKASRGKLRLPQGALLRLPDLATECGFDELPVTFRHAAEVRSLPLLHEDPFDRLLVAQAAVEDLTLVTADEALRGYPVKVVDAG